MSSIEHTPIREIAQLERRRVDVDLSGDYQEIGIRSFGKGVFHKAPVSGASLGSKRVFWIKPNDLLLNNVFAWEGAIAVASKEQNGLIGSHRFMTYVVDDQRADPRYLLYYLLSDHGLKLIRRASPGSAGRNRTLGIQAFESLNIPLPPIEVQRDIACRLDDLRQTAARVQHLQSKAEIVASALPSSLAQRRDLSDREKTALGWIYLPLRKVMKPVVDTHTVQPGAMYPNVGILSFGRGMFEKPPIDASRTSARTLNCIHAGQFIYSRLFAFEGAYTAVPKEYDNHFVSNEFPTFEMRAGAAASYLAAYLRSPAIWEELGRSAKGLGVRRQRIHIDTLLDFEVWLPPDHVQLAVTKQLQRIGEQQTLRARAMQLVGAFSASALNDAFSRIA